MKFWILAAFVPGVFALTDTVWAPSQAPAQDHFQQAFVKSISDEGIVSLESRQEGGSARRQTVELCSTWEAGEPQDLAEGPRMERLRQAFQQGTPVRVQFHGGLTHCLSQVQSL